jgi:hypothetical protein
MYRGQHRPVCCRAIFQQSYFVTDCKWNTCERLLERQMTLQDIGGCLLMFLQVSYDPLRLPGR